MCYLNMFMDFIIVSDTKQPNYKFTTSVTPSLFHLCLFLPHIKVTFDSRLLDLQIMICSQQLRIFCRDLISTTWFWVD